MEIIRKYYDLINNSAGEKVNIEPLIYTIATNFGITSEQVMKQITQAMLKKEPSTPLKTTVNPTVTPTTVPHEQIDWKLTPKELPLISEGDLQTLTTIVKSWITKKKLTTDLMKKWIEEANRMKFSADQARLKFYELVQSAPDLDKSTQQQQQENGSEMPKHERSRKARMFLHQWVYLSRKYVEMILPTLKKDQPTDQLAQKQVAAVNALKDALKKQITLFENKKDRLADDAVYTFQFSEPVLAAIHPYLEDLVDYALANGKLDVAVTGIDTLHHVIEEKITKIQFYIEICRRLQKLSFLAVEEPMKSRLRQANEAIVKHQVVQNQKYQIKWPNGMEEPSLRGLNRELHDFTRSVLKRGVGRPSLGLKTSSASSSPVKYTLSKTSGFPTLKKTPSGAVTPSRIVAKPSGAATSSGTPSKPSGTVVTSSKPSGTTTTPSGNGASGATAVKSSGIFSKPPGVTTMTSSGVTPASSKPTTSSETSKEDVASKQRLQAMNQLVQVYLGKYLLATGNSTTAEICDSAKYPISEEMLTLLVIAVYSCGVPMPSQMTMFKNILANVGQTRMAAAIASQRIQQAQKMTEENYVKIFEYFSKLEKSAEEKKKAEQLARLEKIQEENRKKQEEKLKKEQEKQAEKQAEKEKIEARKREEKERKEREKREEKERKEREIREISERKRREEEDRIQAKRLLAQQEEDRRRKREAEEQVQKEIERRAKMEKEAAEALQGLEEDLLMDDVDFLSEQQSKVDEERKIAEAKRAEERENQIRMMRAQQAQRRREETPPPPPQMARVPQMVTVPQNTETQFTSTPAFSFSAAPKQEAMEQQMDILNAAQEAAGLESYSTVKQEIPEKVSEKPMSAFEKLASLRGRTQSADMKRGSEIQTSMQNPVQNSPLLPSNPPTQQFFPTVTQPLQHMDPPTPIFGQNSNFQRQNSAQSQQMVPHIPPQSPQFHAQQPQVFQQRGPMFTENGSSQNMNMQQSKQGPSMPMNQSPQTLQHQQYPINSYQSPIQTSMNNSSLMHTPLSNNSMVSQSPHQFSSHPSPMSQQYHTPPSVGMMNHGMVQSPMPNQSPLQHFNYPTFSPQRVPQPPQMQQMHRQQNLSQQNLMMMQQQQQNSNQMMHQMNHHHNNYPPQPQ
ncbi:unnamed protein product [Caenorhabditis nigoni]